MTAAPGITPGTDRRVQEMRAAYLLVDAQRGHPGATLGLRPEDFEEFDCRHIAEIILEAGRVPAGEEQLASYAEHAVRLLTPRDRARALAYVRRQPGESVDADEYEADARYPGPVCALNAPPAEPVRWLVNDLVPAGEPTILYGPPGVFKSGLALCAAAAIAGGYALFDLPRFKTGDGSPVLYVSEDDRLSLVTMRTEAFCRGHNWARQKVLANLHFHALDGISLGDARWQQQLLDEAAGLGAHLLVLDPLAHLIEGNENDASEMRRYTRFARRVSDETGATVLWVQHAGKAREGVTGSDRIRGSSAFHGAARAAYEIADRGDNDVGIECVKMSCAEKPVRFSVHRSIEVAPGNRGHWTKARLEYLGPKAAADQWVLRYLAAIDGPKSTEIRVAAGKEGIRGEDVSAAISRLHEAGKIQFRDGSRNARHWYLTEPAQANGQAGRLTVAQPAQPALATRGRLEPARSSLHAVGMQAGIDLEEVTGDI